MGPSFGVSAEPAPESPRVRAVARSREWRMGVAAEWDDRSPSLTWVSGESREKGCDREAVPSYSCGIKRRLEQWSEVDTEGAGDGSWAIKSFFLVKSCHFASRPASTP